MDDERAAWHEQRRQAVAGHAAAQEAGRAAEAEKAAALLADFVRQAGERGLPPSVLTATSVDGRGRYRTNVRGWYLKSNRSVAVGADGQYYVLSVPPSLKARFTGADIRPSVPRLVVGAGGGDGETLPLAQLLQRRLDAGVDWP
jgi:predicted  nucleic acid-binding Zn-ribbon protein